MDKLPEKGITERENLRTKMSLMLKPQDHRMLTQEPSNKRLAKQTTKFCYLPQSRIHNKLKLGCKMQTMLRFNKSLDFRVLKEKKVGRWRISTREKTVFLGLWIQRFRRQTTQIISARVELRSLTSILVNLFSKDRRRYLQNNSRILRLSTKI